MQEYEFHIHGKPYSHDIWKKDALSGYLEHMYSDVYLNASTDESFMVIEIYNKTVHYTYMRSRGVRDKEEREGSFFAITVSFRDKQCSAAALYNLLNQIYEHLAKSYFFTQSRIAGCIKYKVIKLEDANVAELMLNAFEKFKADLNLKRIEIGKDTLKSNTIAVSLKDVDSPEFEELLLRNRIVISPELESAVKRCAATESELARTKKSENTLQTSKEQLESQIATLEQEKESLHRKLHELTSSAEKRYKDTIEQLKSELDKTKKDRDSLNKKMNDVTSSIEDIDQSFQKLVRLLADRFPENHAKRRDRDMEDKRRATGKRYAPVWTGWFNSVLLGLVLVCCTIIFFVVLNYKSTVSGGQSNSSPAGSAAEVLNYNREEPEVVEQVPEGQEETLPYYDSWDECILNIKGGGDNLEINKEYTLSVTKKGEPANVPSGYWTVYINRGEILNNDNSFTITDPSSHGKNVMIEYNVNGQPIKKRVCKIQ